MPVSSLDAIRISFSKALVAFVWLNGALVVGAGFWRGTLPPAATLLCIALLCGVTTVLVLRAPTAVSSRVVSSMALASLVALLVAAFRPDGSGRALQIDMHMYFFACLAIVAAWLDWRPLVAYTGVVAVHHLLLSMTIPALVFPDGGGLDRVVLHAVIIVLETGALIWLTARLQLALSASDSLESTQAAQAEAERLRRAAEEQAIVEMTRRQRVQEEADRFRKEVALLVDQVARSLGGLSTTAVHLSEFAREAVGDTAGAARNASESTQNVQVVAQTCESLSAAIHQITEHVADANRIAVAVGADATRTGDTINELNEHVGRVGSVIDLIRSIADQTNLLALNATIEAARAGEAGRGFAVVASEVKALSSQTAKATEEIARQIHEIQSATGTTVGTMQAFTGQISAIRSSIGLIASAAEQQREATRDIQASIEAAVQCSHDASSTIERVGCSIEKTSGAATHVQGASSDVQKTTTDLNAVVEQFLRGIQAA